MKSNLKKFIIGTTLVSSIVASSILPAFATTHQIVKGDTLWGIAKQYNISLSRLYDLNPKYRSTSVIRIGDSVLVGAPASTPASTNQTYTVQSGDSLSAIALKFRVKTADLAKANNITNYNLIRIDQKLVIPTSGNTTTTPGATNTMYTVQNNDTPWIISNKFGINLNELLKVNNLNNGQHIYPGQTIVIPKAGNTSAVAPPSSSSPTVTYKKHTVVKGDDMWKISVQYGAPFYELLKLNGISQNHILNLGDIIKIPVYNIPIKTTPGAKYGELLDWWTEAQYVVPIGKVFTVVDFRTGVKWQMKRTIGANHADVEPLTSNDTAIMKSVWGGNWSWATRPVIVEVDGRKIAASASAMPHDIQYITNNNFNGHSDIHFYNSTRHKDGLKNESHQNDVLITAGKK